MHSYRQIVVVLSHAMCCIFAIILLIYTCLKLFRHLQDNMLLELDLYLISGL